MNLLTKYNFYFETGGILVNFADENKHGCDNKCKFCHWKKMGTTLNPSDETINEFLNYCRSSLISVSGGGDPLFQYEKNKDDLLRIIATIRRNCRYAELITAKVVEANEHKEDLNKIYRYAFSIQGKNAKFLQAIKEIREYGKRIRIIKVYNPNESIDDIIDFCNYYGDYVDHFNIRENYFEMMDDEDLFNIQKEIIEKTGNSHKIKVDRGFPQLVLVNNLMTSCYDMDEIMYKMMHDEDVSDYIDLIENDKNYNCLNEK